MTLLLILVAIVLAPLVVMAIYVDDWSRDLTTNTAATSVSHPKPTQRPVKTSCTPAEVTLAVEALCEGESAWTLGEAAELPPDSPLSAEMGAPPVAAWSLVRATGIMRYRDDVWLVAEPVGDGVLRLHAESRSRIGKGDLGQNPRNLQELMTWLHERLPPAAP